jgi:hypothetical protein
MAISALGKGLITFGMQQAANTVGGNTAQKRQERLMGINLKNQKELNEQGRNIQMDMWNKTNYGAQVRHMKEAGLSPGLIYGNSGGGGTTTGSQSGGSAASGGAPSRPQMGIEGLMAGHQISLMKAQARKLNAEAANQEGGVKNNLQADYDNKLETIEGQKINNKIQGESAQAQIEKIRKEAVTEGLKQKMLESGMELNDSKIKQLEHKIYQDWAKVGFSGLDSVLSFLNGKKALEVALKKLAMNQR